MALSRSRAGGIALHTPLFDRFTGPGRSGLGDLTRDLADILGARRAIPGRLPGVLSWGLDGIGDFSPSSDEDRHRLADQIARLIDMFEPRMENVVVTPLSHDTEFRFTVEASLVRRGGGAVRLRILTPRRGGADVSMMGPGDGAP